MCVVTPRARRAHRPCTTPCVASTHCPPTRFASRAVRPPTRKLPMNRTKLASALALSLVLATAASAGNMKNPMVGGAAMYSTKDIVDNAVNSKDHTTLVAAVKAAGLVDTLKGPG